MNFNVSSIFPIWPDKEYLSIQISQYFAKCIVEDKTVHRNLNGFDEKIPVKEDDFVLRYSIGYFVVLQTR